jgi:hypothetical protein
MTGRLVSLALLVGGVAVIVGAALAGQGGLLEAIVSPPALIRAALVAAMTLVAIALARASLARFVAAGATQGALAEADPIVMLRGIRLAFLSLASLAAAAGWLLASPLPLVVAGVVAAVDVLETSLLLLVVAPLRSHRVETQASSKPPRG